MRRRRATTGAVVLGSLLGALVVSYLSTRGPAMAHALAVLPVGLGAGAVLRTPPRLRRWTVGATFVLGVVALVAVGRPVLDVVGYSLAATVSLVVACTVLLIGVDGVPSLSTDLDLRRYLVACPAGAAAGSLVVAAIVPEASAPTFGAFVVVSLLCFTPAYLRLPDNAGVAGGIERAVEWVLLVVAAPLLVLLSHQTAPLFLLVPLLAWGAFRLSPPECTVQLLAVSTLVAGLTATGLGPFADIPTRFDVSTDAIGAALASLLAVCALISVPLMVRLGLYVSMTRTVARESDLVRRIVGSSTGVAIVGADRDGRITIFNPGAERLLGYRPEEVLGRSGAMFHTRDGIAQKAAELGVAPTYPTIVEALIARRSVAEHVLFRRKDGVDRTHAMTLDELVDDDGHRVGYLSTSEDITDELGVEHALREALDVERRAVERLREVDGVKDAFVSTVSHELRTPITSILGYLELLSDGSFGSLDARQLDAVLRVASNSARLLGLIDDLLTLSRVSEHGLELAGDHAGSDFDLADAVDAAYAVLTPSWAPPRTLDVRWMRPAVPLPVHGDREMVERVVVNLLGNAVKFTPDGGSVRVRIEPDGGGADGDDVVLEIADTGIGIPRDEQDQLFTRFFRSRLAQHDAIPGSGLGLSISRTIVEQHGGRIDVRSEPGQGTAVRVELPRAAGR